MKWIEFSSGPPMMEAMNVGSVDFGAVGDSPPVFAQAAGAAIVYAAGQPITNGQGILVPRDSPIRDIADLKGKRIGFTKGSSAHNIVVQALEKAGLTYADITPVYLTPPGCRSRLRQWQHRGLGDLGSVFCDRRGQAERPHPDQFA
ncbi:ABC-type nitrate/sulfonate/bicarbonate transport system substrate-binding protein [Bradyrhizobium sp. USDA 4354]